jgi:hypothetical protein
MMGGATFSPTDWDAYSRKASTRSYASTFTASSIHSTGDARTSLDPKDIKVRESRDSEANPASTALMVVFDVTGSMGQIPFQFIKDGLGKLFLEIYDRKPVSDPHVLCAAVGDAYCDSAPFQPTQFEASCPAITSQLEKFYVESGGGGNEGESYLLAHYFSAKKTSIDCFEKRGVKGLLFTIGDEPPLRTLTREQIKTIFGDDVERDLSSKDLVEMASKQWDLYHVVVMDGSGVSGHGEKAVIGGWNDLLPQGHVIKLTDHTKLSEVVVSAMQIAAGVDRDKVVKSWSGATSMVVADSISSELSSHVRGDTKAVVRL